MRAAHTVRLRQPEVVYYRRGTTIPEAGGKGEQCLSIAAFGSAREEPEVCAVVKIGMELKGYPHLYPSACGAHDM